MSDSEPPKFLDQMRTAIRLRGMSYRTEKTYVDWAKRYIKFNSFRHPRELGASEIEAYLGYLANVREASPATRNQCLHALLFVYREVLQIDSPAFEKLPFARKEHRQPVVFTKAEVLLI